MEYRAEGVSRKNTREMKKVVALLNKEGIRLDDNLDYTCAVYDEDDQIIATGSCFQNTLRCMAVSSDHQGEGLMNIVVSHLLEVQSARQNYHLYLYTKVNSAKFFKDLGFYEIARIDDKLVFMENRKDGLDSYINTLKDTIQSGKQAAIVMNANPFTLGHRHLVETASKENDWVHVFVLQEENGPIPFSVRYQLVQAGVEDLINVMVHPSGAYMISNATFPSYFLKDGDEVVQTHAKLDIAVFAKIAHALNITERYVGEEPFSHTTELYNAVMQQQLPQEGIQFHRIERYATESGEIISASQVRQAIHDDRLIEIKDMLPKTTYEYFMSDKARDVVMAIKQTDDLIHH